MVSCLMTFTQFSLQHQYWFDKFRVLVKITRLGIDKINRLNKFFGNISALYISLNLGCINKSDKDKKTPTCRGL
jgi:hypothetical protein